MIKKIESRLFENDIINKISINNEYVNYNSSDLIKIASPYYKIEVHRNYADFEINFDKFINSEDMKHSGNSQPNIYFDNLNFILDEINEQTGLLVEHSIFNTLKLNFKINLKNENINQYLKSAGQLDNDIWQNNTSIDFFISAGKMEGAIKSSFDTDSVIYSLSEYNDLRNDPHIGFHKIVDNPSELKLVFSIPDLYQFYNNRIHNTLRIGLEKNIQKNINGYEGLELGIIKRKIFWRAITSILGAELNKITINEELLLDRKKPTKNIGITNLLAANKSSDEFWDDLKSTHQIHRNTATNNKNTLSPLTKNIENYSANQKEDISYLSYLIDDYYFNNFLDIYNDLSEGYE